MAKSKLEILSKVQRRYTEVDGVRLQSLTELELSNLESRWARKFRDSKGNLYNGMTVELLAICIVDGDGKRLFTDEESEELHSLDGGFAKTLYYKARKHCGMDGPEEDAESVGNESVTTEG